MSKIFLLFCITVCALSLKPTEENAKYYVMDTEFKISEIENHMTETSLQDKTNIATAKFIDDRNISGWTFLYINTSSEHPDELQTYAAGSFEGQLAYELIWATYMNEAGFRDGINADVYDWIDKQTAWIDQQISLNPNDSYWKLVQAGLSQYNGMYAGYASTISSKNLSNMTLSAKEFYLATYLPDLFDVISLYNDGFSKRQPHCSFLLKLTDDDLFSSHTTWMGYEIMLKTYKVYNYSLANPLVHNQVIAFSSQPGIVSSTDDFYILDNNRFVAETSLGSNNDAVYDFLHFESIPYWLRIMVANWGFNTQVDWMNLFFSYRSGTYNNQWIVVDYNQYLDNKANLSAASNIVWMIEEFYQLTSAQDLTQSMLIADGYVASYNVPYNPIIAEMARNPTSYQNDTRAILFRKYAPGITNLQEFQYVMRLNNISDSGDYCEAIACRCDLNESVNQPFGALDCKVTGASMISDMQAWVIVGPTMEDNLPFFSWNDWPSYANQSLQQPRNFNFDWVFMDPYNTNQTENGKNPLQVEF